MTQKPDFSLIITCYNEEAVIRTTATRLISAFRAQNIDLELILVDNGSRDQTGAVIDEMIREGLPIVKAVVDVNEGYGKGLQAGLAVARADLIGCSCADEQVEAPDVVKLYQIAAKARTPKLFKVRRRFRLEGPLRRIVSWLYNLIANALFGELGTMDINANPKVMHRRYFELMSLRSKDWFIDAEMVIKAKSIGLDIFELNVFSQMRLEGPSNVHPSTCWEFVVNLLKFRFAHHAELRRMKEVPLGDADAFVQGK